MKDSSVHKLQEELEAVVHRLSHLTSCLIASHKNPEADALGSQLALHLALAQKGVNCRSFNTSGVPEVLRFLPRCQLIETQLPADFEPECVIVLDSAGLQRVHEEFGKYVQGKEVLNIDHHESNPLFGHMNYVDSSAAATAVLVYRIIKKLVPEFGIEVAENLYAGVVADTGNFSYSNTNAECLVMAADLVTRGVNPHLVYSSIYSSYPLRRMKLLALALQTLEFYPDLKASVISVFTHMYEKTGARPEDTEEFVNFARDIRDVDVAFLIREIKNNHFKISIRSKVSTINAAEIAARMGGGGHRQAAGAEVEGSYEAVKKRLLTLLQEVRTR